MKRLLDYRRGLLLGAGRAASSCGDQILEITLIWAVWQVTQSSSLTGLAVFIQRAPYWLFGFIGATFTDRLGAIVILRRANFSAVGMAGVATVLGCSAAYGIFHGAAYFSIVPRILLSANGGEADVYASIIGAFAFGGIAANVLIAGISAKRAATMVAGGMFVAGMSFLLLGQVSNYAGQVAIGLAGGASLAFQDVFIITLIQKNAPSQLLARAHALWRLGGELGLGFGVLVGGIAADLFSSAYLLIAVGVAIALISATLVIKAGSSSK